MEAEPSVEREGPFYFVFTDKDGEKYGRANKLSGLDKALAAGGTEISKEEYFARKMAHIRAYSKIQIPQKIQNNQSR